MQYQHNFIITVIIKIDKKTSQVYYKVLIVALSDSCEERSITTWHSIIVGPAAFRKYVQDFVIKGTRVLVDGSLNYYKSTMPDGSTKVSASVKASEFFVTTAHQSISV